LYLYQGSITYGDVLKMTSEERKWFIERMVKQKEEEEKQYERMVNNQS